MFHYFSEENLSAQNGQAAAIGIKNWILLMCLSFLSIIPFVGFIVYLVVWLVIAFRAETAVSIANFIKAGLLVAVVSLVVALVLALVFGMALGSAIIGFNGGF